MLESRATVTTGGRLVIPARIRLALKMEVGQEVVLKVENNELHITTLKTAIEHAKSVVRRHNVKKISLTDALIADRRKEAERE